MAKNKTIYEIQIDAEISSLKQSLDQAKNALSSLGGSNFAAGMEKKITNILSAIDKLQKKAGQPIDSKATFSSLEKGFNSVIFDAKNLLGELDKIATLTTKEKISLLPEDEAKKLRDAISAAQDYNKALEKLEKRRIKDLESAKLAKTDTQEKLTSTKSNVKTATTAYKNATAKDTDYGKAQAIVSQAEAAKNAKKEISALEKQLKEYRKELEELKKVENKTPEQEKRLATVRSNISSVSGKIGARTKTVNAAPDEKTLTTAQKTIEQQSPVIEQLAKAVSMAEKEVVRLEKSLQNLDAKINENSTEITASQSDYKVLYEQAKKLGVSLDGISTDVSAENVKQLKDRLLELVNNGVEPVEKAVNDMTPALQKVGEDAKEAGEKVQTFSQSFASMVESNTRLDNLKSTVAQFVGWTGAAKALSAALRNAFEATKELDKAMTEIAVVTDFEVGDMWVQLPEYTDRANELGISITETYEASALFYQQGLDTNEMVELSNETLKMARIAGLEAAEATDRMTAALRGFNMELDQASAQKVADVYSELAAITASDVDEISKAMTKTASIASSAGMEFETTAAFLSQIIETTRESAETAGTAMKTVIARFQELKKAPEDIGEVEGEIVDANQIETALRSVGVSLRDASGQFRELDDVFLELSSKWDGLDKNTQRYIATIAAGSRQQSRFIAMMQDYGRTQELVTAANNSAGASQRQYEKTLDSLAIKLAKLKNAQTEFSTGLMNSDFVKFAVDFLTSILNALNRVTKGFDSVTGSLTKIGTLVAIFQTAKVIVTKFFDDLIAKIYTSSRQAGENIANGVSDGMNKTQSGVPNKKASIYQQSLDGANKIQRANNARKNLFTSGERLGTEEEAIQWKREYNDLQAKRINLEKKGKTTSQQYEEVIQKLTEKDKNRVYTTEELNKLSKEGFDQIIDGAQRAAQAVTMIGVGLGTVGQVFKEAGMEGIGEFFSGFGSIVTSLGTAFMGVISVVKVLGDVLVLTGEKGMLAGIKTQAAWWWVTLIVAALVAVVAVTAAAIKAANNNSAEKKLERAAEAADAAADAAEKMAASYENLRDSLDGISETETNLEKMIKGTDAWKEGVEELNDQVLKLIQEYPELAKFVENDGGVLTIDVNSSEVQQALANAKEAAVSAKVVAAGAQVNVLQAGDQVNYENLNKKAKLDYVNPELMAGLAYAGDVIANVGALATGGAIAGASIGGTAGTVTVPGIGTVAGGTLGGVVGGIIGGISGLLTSITTGQAEAHAEAAADAARDANEASQLKTEQLARALANGDIVEKDGTYKLKEGLTNNAFTNKYSELDVDSLDEFYNKVGDSTDSLIEFGKSLNTTREQSRAYFDTISTQILSMTDQSNWDENSSKIAGNIIDGALGAEVYDNVLEDLSDVDFLDKNLSDDLVKRRTDAIQAAYGTGAQLKEREDGAGYDIVGQDGKAIAEKVTNDTLKNIVASTEAKTKVEDTAEKMPEITDMLLEKLGGEGKNEALIAALTNESGEHLTKQQADLLNITDSTLEDLYDSSALIREAFGSIENLKNTVLNPIRNTQDEFAKLSARAGELGLTLEEQLEQLTSGAAKGLIAKFEQVYEVAGEEGVKAVEEKYKELIVGKTPEQIQEITTLMNGIDWTNQEQLLSLQLQLQAKYGDSADEISKLTAVIGDSTNATSKLKYTTEAFGELYHATERLNAALEKTADLQWEYERLLKTGSSADIADNIEQQKASITKEYQEAMNSYRAAVEVVNNKYASGVGITSSTGQSVTDYIKHDKETGTYDLSWLQLAINAGHFGSEGSETYNQVIKYFEALKDANKIAKDQLDAAKDAAVSLEQLNEQTESGYWSLYNTIGDLLTTQLDKEIELQEKLLEITSSANEKIVNKIQEQINEDRQARENEKAKKDIARLRSRAAYLGMDTSGANTLEILALEKQIEEQEQSLQDTLVDQSLDEMIKANERAAEQREIQIALQREQIEAYKNSPDFQKDILDKMGEFVAEVESGVSITETNLANELKAAGFTTGMDPQEEEAYWTSLNTYTAATMTYIGDVKEALGFGAETPLSTVLDVFNTMLGGEGEQSVVSLLKTLQEELGPADAGGTLAKLLNSLQLAIGGDGNNTVSMLLGALGEAIGSGEGGDTLAGLLEALQTAIGGDAEGPVSTLLTQLEEAIGAGDQVTVAKLLGDLQTAIGGNTEGTVSSLLGSLNNLIGQDGQTTLSSLLAIVGSQIGADPQGEGSLASLLTVIGEKTSNGEDDLTVVDMLEQIKTSIDSQTQLSGTKQAAIAAGEKDSSFQASTHFDLAGDGSEESFTDKDGNYSVEDAEKYVNTVSAATTSTNTTTLQNANKAGSDLYSSIKDSTQGIYSQPLSMKDFYDRINSGKAVSVGNQYFNRQSLTSALTSGKKEDIEKASYQGYIQAYKTTFDDSIKRNRANAAFEDAKKWVRENQTKNTFRGMSTVLESDAYKKAEAAYAEAGLGTADLKKQLSLEITSGAVDDVPVTFKGAPHFVAKIGGKDYGAQLGEPPSSTDAEKQLVGNSPERKWMCMVNGNLRVYAKKSDQKAWSGNETKWFSVKTGEQDTGGGGDNMTKAYLAALRKYKTGGVADFTGPAWLDGTPSKPEYVLSAKQTERFFSLIDVLENYDTNRKKSDDKSGDNYFDIDINVEKIDNDYDIEKMADKIRSMIYEDATYRNVNTINHIR